MRWRCASSASSSRGPSSTRAPAASEVASPQLYVPARQAGELHGPVQGRDPRLLGTGLPDEDRRGAGHRHPPADHAEDQRRVPGRLRRAVRARARRDAPDRARRRPGRLRRLARRARRGRGRGRRRRGGRRRRRRRGPTARRSSPTPAAAAATRWPTRAPAAEPAPTSTTALAGQGRGVHRARASSTPRPRSPRASRTGSCRPTSATRCSRRSSTRSSSTLAR